MAAYLFPRKTKVWLLYLKYMRGDRGRLSLNILREVCYYLPPFTMAAVSRNTALLYDIETQQISCHSLSVILDGAETYIETGRNPLLGVGLGFLHCAITGPFLLPTQSSASLSTPRASAGLVKVNTHFSGMDGQILSSCEKLQLSDQHPKVCFTDRKTNFVEIHFYVWEA